MRRAFVVSLAATVVLAGCSRVQPGPQPTVSQQGFPRPVHGRVTDHVVVISVDGLRPDAIARYNAKTVQRLMREGRYSLTAQTIANSNTLPSHTSMLTGVDSDVHGITWNSDKTGKFGHVKVPTVFGLARDAGFSTAAFYSKPKFNHIAAPGSLDEVHGPTGGAIPWNSAKTVDLVQRYFDTKEPNLTFVHIADADFVGHSFGWMGFLYGQAVRQADLAVARVLDLADERFGRGRYSVILTADHGGHGKRHGSTDPLDTTIPWIVWGEGVQPGDTLSGVRTMDTAATVLWMLNVGAPSSWTGRAVTDAFAPAAASAR
jgi:predicted AlkP superfamily pyrophosphatase or phosphodiesterase